LTRCVDAANWQIGFARKNAIINTKTETNESKRTEVGTPKRATLFLKVCIFILFSIPVGRIYQGIAVFQFRKVIIIAELAEFAVAMLTISPYCLQQRLGLSTGLPA